MAVACLNETVDELIGHSVCNETEQCMMGYCKQCPGKQGVLNFLNALDDIPDEVDYMQWVSTDRTSLI